LIKHYSKATEDDNMFKDDENDNDPEDIGDRDNKDE